MKRIIARRPRSATLIAAPAVAQDTRQARHRPARQLGHGHSASRRKAGIFKKHGLDLELTYTSGSGRDLAAGDFQQRRYRPRGRHHGRDQRLRQRRAGAHHRRGSRPAPPITGMRKPIPASRRIKDANGKTIAFSTNGSSTNSLVLAFIKEFNLKQAAGDRQSAVDAHRRDDRSGRCRLGRAAVRPEGNRRRQDPLVARASDCLDRRGQTIRTIVTNADTLAKRKDVLVRFMNAYRETIDYMYSESAGDEGLRGVQQHPGSDGQARARRFLPAARSSSPMRSRVSTRCCRKRCR